MIKSLTSVKGFGILSLNFNNFTFKIITTGYTEYHGGNHGVLSPI